MVHKIISQVCIDEKRKIKTENVSVPESKPITNYDVFVKSLLFTLKTDEQQVERILKNTSLLISEGEMADDAQNQMGRMSKNITELIKALKKNDRTNILKVLHGRLGKEVASTPFEKHLALSIHLELMNPSKGVLFYYPYLDDFLPLVHDQTKFFKYFRIVDLLRKSSVGESKLDSLVVHKLRTKLGESEDLEVDKRVFDLKKEAVEEAGFKLMIKGNSVSTEIFSVHFEAIPLEGKCQICNKKLFLQGELESLYGVLKNNRSIEDIGLVEQVYLRGASSWSTRASG